MMAIIDQRFRFVMNLHKAGVSMRGIRINFSYIRRRSAFIWSDCAVLWDLV